MMRLNIILILVFASANLLAQKIEIAVQKGHSAEIAFIAFNEDGKLLASYGKDNLIKLWHVPTGKEMASFISATSQPVKSFAFSKGDDFLFVMYENGSIHTWDIATSQLKSTDKPAQLVHFPNQKKYQTSDSSYSIFVDRFYLRKQNRKSGRNSFSKVPIDISQNFTSVAVSEKTQHIMGACQDGKIYVYDFNKGKNVKTLVLHLSSVNSICLSPTGDFFASASDDRSIIIWDTKDLKMVKRLFGRSYRFESLTFDKSGTLLAVGDEFGKGRVINLQSSRLSVSAFQWHDKKVSDIKFSSTGPFIYSAGFDDKISTFDLQKEKVVNSETYLHYINPSETIMKKLGAYQEPFAWVNTMSVSPNGQLLIAGGGWLESVSRKQPQVLWFKNLTTGAVQRIRAHQGSINCLAFNSDLSFVSGAGNELFEWYYNVGERQFYFNKSQLTDVGDIKGLAPFSKDSIIVNAGDKVIGYDLKNAKQFFSAQSNREVSAIVTDKNSGVIAYAAFNDLVIQNIKSRSQKVIENAHTDKITSIAISPIRHLVATASWDATVKLWNSDNGELIATIIAIGKDDHIIITPDNYYFGTKNSLKGIGFKYGKQFVSPEQYDLRFNRPDIVLSRIGFAPANVVRAYQRAYQKRLQKMNFSEQMLSEEIHLPSIQITTADLPLSTTQKSIGFDVKAEDSKYALDRINVFVNNIPVYGLSGIDLSKEKVQELSKRIETNLSFGKNKIQVSCLNEKGVESLLETFEIERTGEIKKPNLHLAVISVSKYANASMNLKYAAKDGRDIANLFRKSDTHYNKITIDTILNQNATKERIFELKKKFAATDVDDDVIVFVSGHGLLDENLDFYFATHDTDFSNPALRGLKYDDLENLLDGIPARKKLLMMDACHSGEVDKTRLQVSQDQSLTLAKGQKGIVKTYTYAAESAEEQYQVGIKTSFELMQELFANVSKGSGSVVISAAAGNSYALESDEWRNGVFTYSLLSGLKNGTADQNKDDQITVTELKDFVSKEVERLTDGRQKPTSRKENLEFDFVIW
jgi:WD40 repeat protein